MSAKKSNIEVVVAPQEVQTSNLLSIRDALNANFCERKSVIDCLMTAILSKKNVFLLGPPGTAKSALANALCNAIGGKYFYCMMGKTTAPEELFGQVSIEGIKNSRYERNTTDMLPEAHIACLDEVFKSSSAVLNTTLTLMNERTFRNGTKVLKTPLQTVIGASNEIPEAEELAALYDRFTIRVKVDYIQQDSELERLLMSGDVEAAPIPTITLEQLHQEQDAVSKVEMSKEIVGSILEIKRLLKQEGMQSSDRTWKQVIQVIKAYAHLNGHTAVEETDLEILENILWEKPEQYKTVKRIVAKVSNPVGEQVMKLTDAIQEVFEHLSQSQIQPTDAANKIKTAIKQLEKLNEKKTNPKVVEALENGRKIQRAILKEYLGFE